MIIFLQGRNTKAYQTIESRKNIIKERGLSVDGTCYKIKFVGKYDFWGDGGVELMLQ